MDENQDAQNNASALLLKSEEQYRLISYYEKYYTMEQYHEYVIIGAGISSMQAAIIFAQNNQDFIILEATNQIGGRIATDCLGDVVKATGEERMEELKWLRENEEAMKCRVDYGATWISKEHSFILKMVREFGIETYPQYFDGLTIYGVSNGKYSEVESLIDHYKDYKKQIQHVLDKIEGIKASFESLMEQEEMRTSYNSIKRKLSSKEKLEELDELGSQSPQLHQQFHLLSEYIDYYDNVTVSKFIRNELNNEFLSDQILNEIETLECISCAKFSMMQLIDDDGCLELLKLYTEKVQNTIDGMKVKKGMLSIVEAMLNKVHEEMLEWRDEVAYHDFIRYCSPVCQIDNQIGEDVRVHIKDSEKVYICNRVLFAAPIAVAGQIKFSRISLSKQLIFDNQEMGVVNRLYMVFESAFWRGKYSGYGSFSSNFPFNELTDLSPANLSCGILAFIFIGDKYSKWVEAHPHPAKREAYLKSVIADIFLKGDKSAAQLQKCFIYNRSFTDHPYIRAAYQATTKPFIWRKVKENGDDYREAYSRDEFNIVYIGSEFAEEHSTYMEGAVRLAREKVFKELGKSDPERK